MKIEGNSIQEAAENLFKLRQYAPYRFGGKWHLAIINGQAYAQRKQSEILSKAVKAGMTSIETATIE